MNDVCPTSKREGKLLRAMKILLAIFLAAMFTSIAIVPFDTEPCTMRPIHRSNEPDGPEISGVNETSAY